MTRALEIQATSLCNLFRQFTRRADMGCILLASPRPLPQVSQGPSSAHAQGPADEGPEVHPHSSLLGKELHSQARREEGRKG